jgi:hypothetical protein
MKPLSISIACAAILAAASFGAHAQGQPPQQEMIKPGQGGGSGAETRGGQSDRSAQPSMEKPGGREAQGSERPADGKGERPARAESTDKSDQKNAADKAGDKRDQKNAADKTDGKSDQKSTADKAGDKPDQKNAADKSDGMNKEADRAGKSDGDRERSADQGKSGGDKPGKQATKEIKPEQKTVIRQTFVKENIRPERINVQVRVGAVVPRTVVLHPLPPTLIEIYPAYRPYKFVLLDDNTILVIDPTDWEIVDVIEV